MSFKEDAQGILKSMNSPTTQSRVQVIQEQSLAERTKDDVMKFLSNRISSIQKSEKLKELIYSKLEERISSDSLGFDELMQILARLDIGANTSADTIMSLFRPTTNGNSAMSELMRPDEESNDMARVFASYSPEELRAIETTMRNLSVITTQQVDSYKEEEKEENK